MVTFAPPNPNVNMDYSKGGEPTVLSFEELEELTSLDDQQKNMFIDKYSYLNEENIAKYLDTIKNSYQNNKLKEGTFYNDLYRYPAKGSI